MQPKITVGILVFTAFLRGSAVCAQQDSNLQPLAPEAERLLFSGENSREIRRPKNPPKSLVDDRSIDVKPIAVAAAGQLWDVIGTERFLDHRLERLAAGLYGCTERNPTYHGSNGFTHDNPDTKKMWRDKALIIGTVAAAQILLAKTPARHSRSARWMIKGLGYFAGARGAASAVRNGLRCGW